MARRAVGLVFASVLLTSARSASLCYDDRPREPGLYDGEIYVDELKRSYVLYVPPGYDGHHPLPLVINSPNTGVAAMQELKQSGLLEAAQRYKFIILTLNGYDLAFNVIQNALAATEGADDIKFVREVSRYLVSRLCIDGDRIFATGISRGGRFSSRLASEMSTEITSIGVVSGLRFPRPNNATRPVPVIAFHGTDDPINPYYKGGPDYWQTGVEEAAQSWAQFNGCRKSAQHRIAKSIVKLVYFHCEENADVVLYKIEGGGHTWPGSEFYYQNQDRLHLGSTTLEISATDMMWDFWSRHVEMRQDKHYWKHRDVSRDDDIVIAALRAEQGAAAAAPRAAQSREYARGGPALERAWGRARARLVRRPDGDLNALLAPSAGWAPRSRASIAAAASAALLGAAALALVASAVRRRREARASTSSSAPLPFL